MTKYLSILGTEKISNHYSKSRGRTKFDIFKKKHLIFFFLHDKQFKRQIDSQENIFLLILQSFDKPNM